MNNLKFINEEIKRTKSSYKHFKLRFELYKEAEDDRDAGLLKEKLDTLIQIKTELEAWYEIKDLYKKGYFSRIALPKESHEKFKKALEVVENA